MKKLLFVLTFSLALPCAGVGQTTSNPAQAATEKPAATSPELSEAFRLNGEAVRLHGQKKYDEALPLAKRSLELRGKALGPDHELVATSLYNLAGIYAAKLRYADAESLLNRALRILEKKFGVDSKNLTDTLEYLALIRFAQRRNGDAEKLYLRALEIKEKAFGPEHLSTAQTLSLFGTFYERVDKPAKAPQYFKRSLAIREKMLGPNHPDLAESLEKCACALTLNDQVDEGNQYLERAIKIRKLAENETVRQPGGVLQGSALRREEPQYPAEARQRRVHGLVVVEVTVDICGRVINARALSGPDELRSASVSAARRWRFSPTRLSGRPVKVIGTIVFNFHL
jgi:TonB family protein